MRVNIILVAMTTFATAWLPSPASADCDAFNKQFLKFNDLKSAYAREMNRIDAMKPLPTTDVALCRAALALGPYGNLIWMAPEPTCFENKAQMDAFANQVRLPRVSGR